MDFLARLWVRLLFFGAWLDCLGSRAALVAGRSSRRWSDAGLKPCSFYWGWAARLKPCPDTNLLASKVNPEIQTVLTQALKRCSTQNQKSYGAGCILSHPFGKLRAGSSKTAKGGAPSVVVLPAVIRGSIPRVGRCLQIAWILRPAKNAGLRMTRHSEDYKTFGRLQDIRKRRNCYG
jgi:hypothetical protein